MLGRVFLPGSSTVEHAFVLGRVFLPGSSTVEHVFVLGQVFLPRPSTIEHVFVLGQANLTLKAKIIIFVSENQLICGYKTKSVKVSILKHRIMKKLLGIIALAACVACTEKPKEVTHPELEDVNIWACIDLIEEEYGILNDSGMVFPDIVRYAWADIDGDGLAELLLGSPEGEFPEVSAVFALGGEQPQLVGFADPSHSLTFYPEGVSTTGTGVIRYNYMDERNRLQDSKLAWTLHIEETQEFDEDDDTDYSGTYIWYAGTTEAREPKLGEDEARLAEFTEPYDLEPEWQPLEGYHEVKEFTASDGTTIVYNAKRYEMTDSNEMGSDFYLELTNPGEENEWLRFYSYYDEAVDVLTEHHNMEALAENLQAACVENKTILLEDTDYVIEEDTSFVTSLEYYNPEKGYAYVYNGTCKGKPVYGIIITGPIHGTNVLLMRAESPSITTRNRIWDHYSSLRFDR